MAVYIKPYSANSPQSYEKKMICAKKMHKMAEIFAYVKKKQYLCSRFRNESGLMPRS